MINGRRATASIFLPSHIPSNKRKIRLYRCSDSAQFSFPLNVYLSLAPLDELSRLCRQRLRFIEVESPSPVRHYLMYTPILYYFLTSPLLTPFNP